LMSGLQIGLEFKQNRQRNELAKAELGQQAQEIQQRGQRLQIEDQVLQQGMKLKIQDAQRKFQAQQGYQSFVSGGGDPVEGMMKFGPQMGKSLTGLGGIANARRQAADIPKEIAVTPEGTRIWQSQGHLYGFDKPTAASLPGHMTDEQKEAQKRADAEREFKLKNLQADKARIDKAEAALPTEMLPDELRSAKAKTLRIQRERNDAAFKALKYNPAGENPVDETNKNADAVAPEDAGPPAAGAGGDVVATYDPKTGTFKKSTK
jgi:exonuclease VII large subunit